MASILKVDTIQDQDGNNIINESANTITIGASGDTITIPSGATLANSGIVTGFESTGIDDNATSTAITIDSSEDVDIGATISNTGATSPQVTISSTGEQLLLQGTTNGIGQSIDILFEQKLTNDNTRAGGKISSVATGAYTAGSGDTYESALVFYSSDNNLNTERMRIDSSGNVGIGNTVASTINSANGTGNLVVGSGSGTEGITIYSGTTGEGTLQFADASTGAGTYVGQINYNHSSNFMSFGVGGSEAFRYGLGGLIIGKTSGTITDTGNYLGGNNGNNMVRAGGTVCGFNREATDGIIIEFSGDGTVEGNISVSGSTVSYNGFTGTHWSRFQDNSTPTILKGTVLESLDEMCDWYNLEFDVTDEEGNTSRRIIPHVLTDSQSNGDVITYNHEGTDVQATIVKEADIKHVKSKVSDTTDAKNVYGVFIDYDNDGDGYNDFYVASVGSFVVRIKANETIAKGDLLQSNGDGTAKVQTDDAVRSSSFAKVLSTTIIETYEDGSYLVPCSLMC